MTIVEFMRVVLGNIPVDKGNMLREAPMFFDTPYEYLCVYSGVEYLTYQEEGTKYFTGNKGFIRNRTMGQLNELSMSETLGLPFDWTQNNKNNLDNKDKMLEELGVIQYV